jgi:hypothetical protein
MKNMSKKPSEIWDIPSPEVRRALSTENRYMKTEIAIRLVLDFVERYNKQNAEREVAGATAYLRGMFPSNDETTTQSQQIVEEMEDDLKVIFGV